MKIFSVVILSIVLSIQTALAESWIEEPDITLSITAEVENREILIEKEFTPLIESDADINVVNNSTTVRNELEIEDLKLYQDTSIDYENNSHFNKVITFIGAVSPIGSVFYLKKTF